MGTLSLFLAALLPIQQMAVEAVNRRIGGADPTKALSRFDDYPSAFTSPFNFITSPRPKANPSFWLKGVDFSCVSPWNDATGRHRAGTVISPRHIVFSKHFPLWKGVRILFTDDEGNVCPCCVEKTKGIGMSDIMVASLDSEVTPNIKPAKILPPDYEKYIGDGKGLPVVTFNQDEKVFLTALESIPTNSVLPCHVGTCEYKGGEGLREGIVGGDSGNPAFLLIGDSPVFLYCLNRGGCGSGSGIHRYAKEVQAAMDELCLGYKLTFFDFKDLKVKD